MPEERRKIFDQEAEEFLAEDFSDRVVIFTWCEGGGKADQQERASDQKGTTTETLKNRVFLTGSKGRKSELQEFAWVGESRQSFQFAFPRKVGGVELVGPDDKSLQLELQVPDIRAKGSRRVRVEFRPKKMRVNGQLVY